MRKWIAFGVVGLAIAVTVIVLIRSCSGPTTAPARDGSASLPSPSSSGLDPLVEEFRAIERTSLQRFNDALRRQREGAIDELELSNTIERDVLVPWRALRSRVNAAPAQGELYAVLRRYLEARQLSWEAYVTALRAPGDAAARPHYDVHRQKNAEAQEEAKVLGRLFRAAAARP